MELTSDLKTTRTPGIEITSKYGFDDQQSLSKNFKKIHNAPPGQWRKKKG